MDLNCEKPHAPTAVMDYPPENTRTVLCPRLSCSHKFSYYDEITLYISVMASVLEGKFGKRLHERFTEPVTQLQMWDAQAACLSVARQRPLSILRALSCSHLGLRLLVREPPQSFGVSHPRLGGLGATALRTVHFSYGCRNVVSIPLFRPFLGTMVFGRPWGTSDSREVKRLPSLLFWGD